MIFISLNSTFLFYFLILFYFTLFSSYILYSIPCLFFIQFYISTLHFSISILIFLQFSIYFIKIYLFLLYSILFYSVHSTVCYSLAWILYSIWILFCSAPFILFLFTRPVYYMFVSILFLYSVLFIHFIALYFSVLSSNFRWLVLYICPWAFLLYFIHLVFIL